MTEEPGFLEEAGQALAGSGKVARAAALGTIEAISYLAVPILCVGLAAAITVFLVRLPQKVMRNE